MTKLSNISNNFFKNIKIYLMNKIPNLFISKICKNQKNIFKIIKNFLQIAIKIKKLKFQVLFQGLVNKIIKKILTI